MQVPKRELPKPLRGAFQAEAPAKFSKAESLGCAKTNPSTKAQFLESLLKRTSERPPLRQGGRETKHHSFATEIGQCIPLHETIRFLAFSSSRPCPFCPPWPPSLAVKPCPFGSRRLFGSRQIQPETALGLPQGEEQPFVSCKQHLAFERADCRRRECPGRFAQTFEKRRRPSQNSAPAKFWSLPPQPKFTRRSPRTPFIASSF